MWSALRWVRTTRPASGLFENVVGLSLRHGGEAQSALQLIVSELTLLGYATRVWEANLELFHEVSRARRAWLAACLPFCFYG